MSTDDLTMGGAPSRRRAGADPVIAAVQKEETRKVTVHLPAHVYHEINLRVAQLKVHGRASMTQWIIDACEARLEREG